MFKEAIEKQAVIACNARCDGICHFTGKHGNIRRCDIYLD